MFLMKLFYFSLLPSIINFRYNANCKEGDESLTYKIGDVLEGKVTGIQSYGAFVSLDKHTQGLIHISEIQSGYTKSIHDILMIGETVKVQIIDIDEYTQKISLSKRTLEKRYTFGSLRHKKYYFTNKNKNFGFQTIHDRMPQWIHESMEMLNSKKD